MRNSHFLWVLLVLGAISGCATNGQNGNHYPPKIDRISEEELNRIMPKPVAAVSLDDLVKLSKEGVSADQIIEKIKASHSAYDLTPSQSVDLNKQGVDAKVLDYMHASRAEALRNNVADEINKRESNKRAEVERLKRQQWLEQQQWFYDPMFGYGAFGPGFGYSPFGYRPRFGFGFRR